jgi:hypothetical protein
VLSALTLKWLAGLTTQGVVADAFFANVVARGINISPIKAKLAIRDFDLVLIVDSFMCGRLAQPEWRTPDVLTYELNT